MALVYGYSLSSFEDESEEHTERVLGQLGALSGPILLRCRARQSCTWGQQVLSWEGKLKWGSLEGTVLCLTLSALSSSSRPVQRLPCCRSPRPQHPQSSSPGWSWSPLLPWGCRL